MNCYKNTSSFHPPLSRVLLGAIVLGTTLFGATVSAQETTPTAANTSDAMASDATLRAQAQSPTPTVGWSAANALMVSIRGANYETYDESFDAFGDEASYAGVQVEVGYDLGKALLPGLRGYVVYSGGAHAQQNNFGGALSLDWRRDLLMVAADYGPELWGVFRPSLRLGGGYAAQTLTSEVNNIERSDMAHGIAGFAGVSLELFTPRGFLGRAQLGVVVEAGGLLQTGATFDDMQEEDDTDGAWSHQQASLGELNASGGYISSGVELIVHFD